MLRSLTAPHKPSEKSYANIVEILSAHLSPKPLVIAERFRFHKRDQREGETISIFVADIRKLSRHCEFGEALDSYLRDRLVCGLRNESIQKRLLSERDLTFTRAIDTAVAMETAAKDASELQNQRRMETEIHKLGFGKTSSRMPINKNCHRCNGKHDPSECRFKEAICHNCSKRGHICNACKSKPQSKRSPRTESGNKINAIESDDEYDSTVGAIDVFQHHHAGWTRISGYGSTSKSIRLICAWSWIQDRGCRSSPNRIMNPNFRIYRYELRPCCSRHTRGNESHQLVVSK